MENIKKNISYNVIYQILIIILPLITAPYISRVMGADVLGQYSYSYSVVYYFSLFILLGLNNFGNRTIAQVREDKNDASRKFCSIYLMQILVGLIVIIIYTIYAFSGLCKYHEIALIQIIYLLGSTIDINWFFFGLEKFKITVTRNIIIKVLSVLSIFILVKKPEDIYIYTAIMSLSNFISQIFLWGFLRKEIKLQKVTASEVIQHIKPNLILFIPVIAVSLYKVIDKVMLGNMADIKYVALFENAEKVINIPTSIITAVGTVMLPRMSNLMQNDKEQEAKEYIRKSIKLILLIAFPMTAGIMVIGEKFAPIYFGAEFAETGILMKYLSVTIIFIAFANVLRTQYLIPKEKDKVYIISVSIGAVMNMVTNCILIPKYNAMGAVVGTILAEFSVMFVQSIAVWKELKLSQYIGTFIKYFLCALIMYILIYPLKYLIDNDLCCIIIQMVFGVLIYGLLTFKDVIKVIKFRKGEE